MNIQFKRMHFIIVLIFATLALAVTVGLDLANARSIFKVNNFIIALAVLYGLIGLISVYKKENK